MDTVSKQQKWYVHITTVPHLLTQIRKAKTGKTLQQMENRFRKYDLVICYEMGYVGFDKEGADLLFNMISTYTTKLTDHTTRYGFEAFYITSH